MTNTEVLLIEDEKQILKLLEITLQSNGFTVSQAENAKQGLALAANRPPDLILLDLGLPDMSGHDVLSKLREWYTKPIIIVSAQSGEEDIVKALDNGANDYLTKPFRTGELLARIRSAARSLPKENNSPVLIVGNLEIDFSTHTVRKEKVVLKLTSTEYELLSLFAKHEGKVLTHRFVLNQIWGPTYVNESQYLRVYIAQLRKKIEDDANKPKYILTESGIGYRFVIPV